MSEAPEKKTVLVFGTFDGLHDGHRFFLNEAKKLGTRLIASVAQDSTVERFKKHPPQHLLAERMAALLQSSLVDEVTPGDTELGTFTAITTCTPDVIALGYDQTRLEEKLREFIQNEHLYIEIVKIGPTEPDSLHSSLLRHK